ncbi:MAG: hypothetical protein R2706_07780 [Acidimicrobiales bacterium]
MSTRVIIPRGATVRRTATFVLPDPQTIRSYLSSLRRSDVRIGDLTTTDEQPIEITTSASISVFLPPSSNRNTGPKSSYV